MNNQITKGRTSTGDMSGPQVVKRARWTTSAIRLLATKLSGGIWKDATGYRRGFSWHLMRAHDDDGRVTKVYWAKYVFESDGHGDTTWNEYTRK